MEINIRQMVLEEGILEGFKSKTGLGLAAAAGVAGGIGLHKDFAKSGTKNASEYMGQKFNQAKDSFNDAKENFNKGTNTPEPKDHSDYTDNVTI